MLWGIPSQTVFFISSDLGQQVPQHDVEQQQQQRKDFKPFLPGKIGV
jgi:hypothetical protein